MVRQLSHPPSNNKVLDYLENELKNFSTAQPLTSGPHYSGASHHPSMLSSLGEVGVREVERRVIQLPPLVEHIVSSHRSSNSSHHHRRHNSWDALESDRRRNGPPEDVYHTESDWRDRERSDRSHGYRRGPPNDGRVRRDPSPPRRLDRSDDSAYDDPRGHSNQGSDRRRSPERSRRRSPERFSRRRSHSPPYRRNSWSSDDESQYARGRRERRPQSYDWPEDKPPSYKSLDVTVGKGKGQRATAGRQSVSWPKLYDSGERRCN